MQSTHTTITAMDAQVRVSDLSGIMDSFVNILGPSRQVVCDFSELRDRFESSAGLAKTLLVANVENESDLLDRNENVDPMENQQRINQQLKRVCGLNVAPIGEGEYAILLLGYDQCSELVPRLENIVARAKAGHLNGDGRSLQCRLGVVRCPIDTEDLRSAIAMASAAANELIESDCHFQFISRRHKVRTV